MKQLFLVLFIFVSLSANADSSGSCGDNLTWNYVEATHTLTISGSGEMGSSIPWASIKKEITTVDIKEGVTSLCSSAFSYCINLTSVEIPNSLTTIEYGAFENCTALPSVTLPQGITKLGYSVFNNCSALTSVTVKCVPTSVGLGIFEKCDNIKEVTFDCKRVRNYFKGITSIEKVTLNEGITQIDDEAFYECSGITSITIPSSVTNLGNSAFFHCTGLTSATILCDPTNLSGPSVGTFLRCDNIKEAVLDCKKVLPYFRNLPIEKVTLSEKVTTIGDCAFRGCEKLTAITLPKDVTSIEDYAFHGAPLTEITLPSNLTSIDNYAFALTDIASIVIPDNVTSLGEGVFDHCKLTSVVVGNGVKQLKSRVFGCDKPIMSLTIGSKVTSISSNAFIPSGVSWGYSPIKTFWMPNTPPASYSTAKGKVNYVPNGQYSSLSQQMVYPFLSSVFEVDGIKYVPVNPSERTCDAVDCAYSEAMSSVSIGKTVTYMGVELTVKAAKDYICYENPYLKEVEVACDGDIWPYAFYGCTNLNKVTAVNNGIIGGFAFGKITSNYNAYLNNRSNIANEAFSESTGLQQIEIGESVEDIGERAFIDCSSLASLKTNNSGFIGSRAFSGCTALTSVTVNNATNLGVQVFASCSALKEAKINITGKLDASAFYMCTALKTIELGKDVKRIEREAFAYCESLTSVVIPGSVETLGEGCFKNCYALKSVVLGNGVTSLSTYLFHNCKQLSSVEINGPVSYIGIAAFMGCASLPEFTIPKSVIYVDNYAFAECSSLKEINMEDGAAELRLGSNDTKALFADCPLEKVYIGRNIDYDATSSCGYSPFYRNATLQSVTITDKETEILANEFYGCTSLEEVNIGDGVITIGQRGFSGCSALTSFTFGSSVKEIGREAFSDCTAMTSLTSHATTPPTCGALALDDINKWTCKLIIPRGTLTDYQNADQWKEFFFIEEKDITGISSISKGEDTYVKDCYKFDGTKSHNIKRGLNILKMSNGTVKKVFVK